MKTKIKYGLKEYFRPTPEGIKMFLLYWKGIIGAGIFAAYSESSIKNALIIATIGFVIDFGLQFVGKHPELFAVEEAEAAIKDKVEEVAKEIINTGNEIQ